MSPRLWFRFEDVLPLAEHAMACADHRLAPAGLPDPVRHGPALILDRSGPSARLLSNGLPAWFERVGVEHAAFASTWRHTVTGRFGLPPMPPGEVAYVPLDEPGPEQPLIRRLRSARNWGDFWIAVDAGEGSVLSTDAVTPTAQRGDLAPPDARWVAAIVKISKPWSAAYPALIPAGYTTDGGEAIPRFDRATVQRMADDFAAVHANPNQHTDLMPGECPVLSFHEWQTLLVARQVDIGGDSPITRVTDVLEPDADGLYAVGAHEWPWETVPDAPGTPSALGALG